MSSHETRETGMTIGKGNLSQAKLEEAQQRLRQLEAAPGSETPDTCSGCGGPYRFDTSLPSVLWNRVIRAQELPEKLCTTCIIQHFVRAGVSFTAELFGDGFKGEQFLVQVAGAESKTVALLNDENNRLRTELREAEQRFVTLEAELARVQAFLSDASPKNAKLYAAEVARVKALEQENQVLRERERAR